MRDWEDEYPTPTERRQMKARKYYSREDVYEKEMKPREERAVKGYIERGKKIRPSKPTQAERRGIIPASHGFHGTIYKPTKFIVGEEGKERVDIYATEKRKKNIHTNYWDLDLTKMFGDMNW